MIKVNKRDKKNYNGVQKISRKYYRFKLILSAFFFFKLSYNKR